MLHVGTSEQAAHVQKPPQNFRKPWKLLLNTTFKTYKIVWLLVSKIQNNGGKHESGQNCMHPKSFSAAYLAMAGH